MKVETCADNPAVAIVTLEDPNSFGLLKSGIEDHRRWQLHPETNELATYIRDNGKFTQIVVKTGESYIRVK